jgi:Tol biopolymer transport system component
MLRDAPRFFLRCLIVSAAALCPRAATAQNATLPHLPWRTLDTRYFRFFYTADAEEWTRDVASRIDGARDAVVALVGSGPAKRVTVIVEDPNNISNGFALPLLDHPLIFLWPTPPSPTSPLGNGSWGDQLSIHEYAHIAHLTRESRSPAVRRLTRLLPVKLGPLAVKSPRWVAEGYATFVEGRIVRRIGRPHGVWRAAVLRQWAIEGQLPTYAALDGSARFEGGDMAYLAGSAFLEWLAAREGDSSVVHLWRRMSARQPRTFAEAFAGVYGAPPDEMYGRFAAELTHDALDDVAGGPQRALLARVADTTSHPGEGELVQRLHWGTGAPSISRDDSLLAIVLRDPKRPSRVVIWSLSPPHAESGARLAAARDREADPEDVRPVHAQPPQLRVISELGVRGGMAFGEPRFFPDGVHVLLTGLAARGDGAYRGDLFEWNWKTGEVRRVTRGAGIRHGDVSPSGTEAIADRCVAGRCDLVRVNLATGAITMVVRGSRERVYDRPRWSPDGRTAVFGVQWHGVWRVGTLRGVSDTSVSLFDRDANEYTPSWMSNDDVVATTEAGGVANVERLSLARAQLRRSTNVSGAAVDPETASDGWVYFLRLHARGWDVAKTRLDTTASLWATQVDSAPRDYPWVTPKSDGGTIDSLPVAALPPSRAYGFGPREQRLLVSASWANEGKSGGLAYAGTDPVGKLTWLVQGQWGDRASWRGASAGAVFRGSRPLFGVEAFALENQPSRQHGNDAPSALDARYRGASIWSELDDDWQSHSLDVRALASYGTVDPLLFDAMHRALAQLTLTGGLLQTPGTWRFSEHVGVAGAAGRLGDESWTRIVLTGAATVRGRGHALALDGMYGRISADIPYENFALGGLAPPLVDSALLAQRVSMPVLPIAAATGRSVATLRISAPGAIWRPYYWIGSASDVLGPWSQVIGIEGNWQTEGVWMVRVPGVNLLGGIGYSLAGADRHHAQAYMSVVYRP